MQHCHDNQGDQIFLRKNRQKTTKNRPKSRPTMFLLDLLYKTVLWCFLFDFMLISNGTGHSFIVFWHKKGDIIFWIFLRHVKKTLIIGQFFSRKNFAIKNSPNGEILPNLVTLVFCLNTWIPLHSNVSHQLENMKSDDPSVSCLVWAPFQENQLPMEEDQL